MRINGIKVNPGSAYKFRSLCGGGWAVKVKQLNGKRDLLLGGTLMDVEAEKLATFIRGAKGSLKVGELVEAAGIFLAEVVREPCWFANEIFSGPSVVVRTNVRVA